MADLSGAYEITPGSDFQVRFERLAGTQLLTLSGGATGGTFTLSYSGQTTSALAYNVDGTTMQAALEALSSIGAGNVTVSGGAGGPWTVTPQNQISATDFTKTTNLLKANLSGLTGGTNNRMAVTTPPLDISTGYTYELQARSIAGSTSPDIDVTMTANANGDVITLDGPNGLIKILVSRTTTAALDFTHSGSTPTASNPGYAQFVLMEKHSSLWTSLISGQLHLRAQVFR